jgi:ferredoxin
MSCILQDICAGRGRPEHLAMIERLAAYMSSSALCALGTSAPNPVAGALRHFRSEFEAHIRDKKCPAGVCKALTTFAIDAAVCNGCGACAKACTVEAVSGKKKETHVIDPKKCTRCGQCREVCPRDAVKVV